MLLLVLLCAAIRLNSFRKLDVIARALGPVRTRDELVPYLNEFIDEDDEVLVVLSEELGKLVEHVGGGAYAHVLLTPLETLSGVEESSVREKVVESITTISKQMNNENVIKHVVPMVRRLANGDWFTSRISAAGLFAVTYPRADEPHKKLLRRYEHCATQHSALSYRCLLTALLLVFLPCSSYSLYTSLCSDETPMVRRAACSQFAVCTSH